MKITDLIQDGVIAGIQSLYGEPIAADQDHHVRYPQKFEEITQSLSVKIAKKKPDEIAQELGQFMVDNVRRVDGF
ncbi:MAG: hypothetical protein R2788_22720 [Saprospiraceae bacterium]